MTTNTADVIIETLKHATPWNVFSYASAVNKLCLLIALAALAVAVAAAVVRRGRAGARSGLLTVAGYIGLAFAALSALYTATISLTAAHRAGITEPVVLLPSMIEVAYSLILGVLVWGVAFWGNHGAKRA